MKKNNSVKILIKSFLPYLKKYKFILFLDLLFAAFSTVCDLSFPLIVRHLTDIASTDISKLTFNLIFIVAAIYIVLSILDTLANYYMISVGHIMGSKIETDMRKDLFSHIQTLSFSYFSKVKTGELMSRITYDLFEITEFAHHCPEEFFIAAIKIIVPLIILSFINVPLTFIIFAYLILLLVFSWHFNKKLKHVFKKSNQQIADLHSQIEDSLSGIKVVKSFANEQLEEEKIKKSNKEYLSIKRNMYHAVAGFNSGSRMFIRLIYISVTAIGAILIKWVKINPADLITYLLYISTLLTSIMRIVKFAEQFHKGMTGIERFNAVMNTKPKITDSDDSIELNDIKGNIKFENVSFKYDDDSENVLSNINIDIKAGENIALVGPSGIGKTTICNLIPRFYDVTQGAIYIDGVNIKNIKQQNLRQNIGAVHQDIYLFYGTIADNIAYGKPEATREEIIRAAKDAGADEFIKNLPNGYDTHVGQKGIRLSGGEKQRISIARAFLKNPPILIMDEATSSLDNKSEEIVKTSLEKLSRGRTTITVAHRLTTIKNSSNIIVLTENGIEEQGTHEELLKKDGIYKSFYELYT